MRGNHDNYESIGGGERLETIHIFFIPILFILVIFILISTDVLKEIDLDAIIVINKKQIVILLHKSQLLSVYFPLSSMIERFIFVWQ